MTVFVIGDDPLAEQNLNYLFEYEGFAVKFRTYDNHCVQALPDLDRSVVLLECRCYPRM